MCFQNIVNVDSCICYNLAEVHGSAPTVHGVGTFSLRTAPGAKNLLVIQISVPVQHNLDSPISRWNGRLVKIETFVVTASVKNDDSNLDDSISPDRYLNLVSIYGHLDCSLRASACLISMHISRFVMVSGVRIPCSSYWKATHHKRMELLT